MGRHRGGDKWRTLLAERERRMDKWDTVMLFLMAEYSDH